MSKRLAYSYLRFSSPEQGKGNSLRRQMELAAEYAAGQGWDLDRTLKDEGMSAYSGDHLKGAFGAFLGEVEAGRVPRGSILIVESLDRLSRAHPLDAQQQFHGLLKAGIEIVTLTDRRHYTWESVRAEPTLLLGSIMVMMRAHEESTVKSRRIQDAWANKRKRASTDRTRPLTLKAPHWLTWNEASKQWDLVASRVAVIRRIFELTADQGHGMAKIASVLNAEGVPTLTGRTLSPGVSPGWQPATIGQLLCARTVLGEMQANTQVSPGVYRPDPKAPAIPDYYPQIISWDLWNRVHAVRAQNTRSGGRKDGRVGNLFRGRVFCAHCGSVTRTRYAKSTGSADDYKYVVCDASRRSTNACTSRTWVDLDAIERGVLAGVKFRLSFWEQRSTHNDEVKALNEQLAALQAEFARRERKFTALGEMLVEDDSPRLRAEYRDVGRWLDNYDAERASLQRQIAQAMGTGSYGDMIREAETLEQESRADDLTVRLPARNRLSVLMCSIVGRIEVSSDRTSSVIMADNSLRFQVVKGEVVNLDYNIHGVWHEFRDGIGPLPKQ